MWVYGLLLLVIVLILLFSSFYFVKLIHKILSKWIKNIFLLWVLSFIPLLILILLVFIDVVNVIVVYIHIICIVLLTKLVFLIIKKQFKKEFNEYLIFGIGLIISSIVLVYGYYLAHHVVETNYVVYTEKNINDFRIVQISDSHIGTTMNGKKFASYMEEINKLKPDIVVITGDYIDDSTTNDDLKEASIGLGKLKTKYGVYYVFGNHDIGYRNNREDQLREELIKNNVLVLEDCLINITDDIILIGRKDKSNNNRVDIFTLTSDLDKNKYIILLDHQPNDYENEKNAEVDLVLSGHTHGGQLFPLGMFGILLGANDKEYGIETRDNTTFIVNSGISNWALKFKTGTVSEYGVIDIKRK